jgi:hypothetical protein
MDKNIVAGMTDTAKMIMVAIITSIAWIFWFSAIYPALILD